MWVQGYSNCHCSGCEDPESFVKPYHWWADPADKIRRHWDNYQIPAEGVPVIDITKAIETKDGYKWVFQGPLLNVDLADGEIKRLGDVFPLMLPAVAAYGQMTALADTMLARRENRAGALDDVGVTDYIRGWREHGARVGRFYVQGGIGRIEWETEVIS